MKVIQELSSTMLHQKCVGLKITLLSPIRIQDSLSVFNEILLLTQQSVIK